MIKLIVFDYDGSLVQKNSKIDHTIVNNLIKWKNKDIMITIASGRNYRSLKGALSGLPFDIPIISNNGNLIRMLKSEYTINKNPLDKKLVSEAIIVFNEFNINPIFHVDSYCRGYDLVILKEDSISKKYVSYYENRYKQLNPDLLWNEDVLSIVAYTDQDIYTKIKNILKKNFPLLSSHHLTKGIDRTGMLEVVGERCSKWTAVEKLSNIYGISKDHIIAVGDDMNDFEMIKEAGIGIALNNSAKEIIEIADYITEHDVSQYGGINAVNTLLELEK